MAVYDIKIQTNKYSSTQILKRQHPTPSLSLSRRHRIAPPRMQGMAARNAPQRQAQSPEKRMGPKTFVRVLGAGGMKAAGGTEEGILDWGQNYLVQTYQNPGDQRQKAVQVAQGSTSRRKTTLRRCSPPQRILIIALDGKEDEIGQRLLGRTRRQIVAHVLPGLGDDLPRPAAGVFD